MLCAGVLPDGCFGSVFFGGRLSDWAPFEGYRVSEGIGDGGGRGYPSFPSPTHSADIALLMIDYLDKPQNGRLFFYSKPGESDKSIWTARFDLISTRIIPTENGSTIHVLPGQPSEILAYHQRRLNECGAISYPNLVKMAMDELEGLRKFGFRRTLPVGPDGRYPIV